MYATQKQKDIAERNVPKLQLSYETCCSGRHRIRFDHMGMLNMHRILVERSFSHFLLQLKLAHRRRDSTSVTTLSSRVT